MQLSKKQVIKKQGNAFSSLPFRVTFHLAKNAAQKFAFEMFHQTSAKYRCHGFPPYVLAAVSAKY